MNSSLSSSSTATTMSVSSSRSGKWCSVLAAVGMASCLLTACTMPTFIVQDDRLVYTANRKGGGQRTLNSNIVVLYQKENSSDGRSRGVFYSASAAEDFRRHEFHVPYKRIDNPTEVQNVTIRALEEERQAEANRLLRQQQQRKQQRQQRRQQQMLQQQQQQEQQQQQLRRTQQDSEQILEPKEDEISEEEVDDYDTILKKLVETYPQQCKGKEPMLRLLLEAGMLLRESVSSAFKEDQSAKNVESDNEQSTGSSNSSFAVANNNSTTFILMLCRHLPRWENVIDLYGDGPTVAGLETCQRYRDIIQEANRKIDNSQKEKMNNSKNKRKLRPRVYPIPKVAALWNTGSTAFSRTLQRNILHYSEMMDGLGRTTVPWGKHTNPRLRTNVTFPPNNPDTVEHIMPVVLVRDPFRWMNSMCYHPYSARWSSGINNRCPNLIPTLQEQETLGDEIAFDPTHPTYEVYHENYQSYFKYVTKYKSLADMWSTFNNDYYEADYPRLFVRMEDLIFYPKQVVDIISECTGAPIQEDHFDYLVGKSKVKSDTTLATAMIKYGTHIGRIHQNLTLEEKRYLQNAFDPKLMKAFNYRPIQDVEIR